MKQVSTIFLVKDPPLDRLAALVEYLRVISDQFIFVVDSRSTDETFRTIQSWPDCSTHSFEWEDDFAKARNVALNYTTRPWTLHVDPDELPSWEMIDFIMLNTAEDAPDMPLGYIFWTPNWWGGVRGEDQMYHWHIRLWRTGHGQFYRRVHELVMLDGRPEQDTRGTLAVQAPKSAYLIHSKPAELLERDQAYYERLGERSM